MAASPTSLFSTPTIHTNEISFHETFLNSLILSSLSSPSSSFISSSLPSPSSSSISSSLPSPSTSPTPAALVAFHSGTPSSSNASSATLTPTAPAVSFFPSSTSTSTLSSVPAPVSSLSSNVIAASSGLPSAQTGAREESKHLSREALEAARFIETYRLAQPTRKIMSVHDVEFRRLTADLRARQKLEAQSAGLAATEKKPEGFWRKARNMVGMGKKKKVGVNVGA